MSKADERRAEQTTLDRDMVEHGRPFEDIVPTADPDPTSWGSRCAGWRFGQHERLRIEPNGMWTCRWCFQLFQPPTCAHCGQPCSHVAYRLRLIKGRQSREVFVCSETCRDDERASLA